MPPTPHLLPDHGRARLAMLPPAVRHAAACCHHPPATCAGVPCLTLAGACHAHNVGVSLLTAVGLQQDWVAHSGGLI